MEIAIRFWDWCWWCHFLPIDHVVVDVIKFIPLFEQGCHRIVHVQLQGSEKIMIACVVLKCTYIYHILFCRLPSMLLSGILLVTFWLHQLMMTQSNYGHNNLITGYQYMYWSNTHMLHLYNGAPCQDNGIVQDCFLQCK